MRCTYIKIFSSFLFLMLSLILTAQILTPEWIKTIDGNRKDFLPSITKWSKDSYLTVVHSNSRDGIFMNAPAGTSSYWMELDKDGEVISVIPYNRPGAELKSEIIPHCDGFIGSATKTNWRDSSQFWLSKMDEDLNQIWEYAIFANNKTWFNSIKVNDDATISIIIRTASKTGFFANTSSNSATVWHVHLSAEGVLLSKKKLDLLPGAAASDLISTNNAHYLYGTVYSSGSTIQDDNIFMCKLDQNWELEWYKEYGGSQYDFSFEFFLTADDHFISVSGIDKADGDITNPLGNFGRHVWLAKFDLDGNIVADRAIGLSSSPGRLRPFCDHTFLIDFDGGLHPDSMITGHLFINIDQDLNTIDRKIYNPTSPSLEHVFDLHADYDGSILMSVGPRISSQRQEINLYKFNVDSWGKPKFEVITYPSVDTNCQYDVQVDQICQTKTDIYQYIWKKGDVIIAETTNPIMRFSKSDNYTVEINTLSECGLILNQECHDFILTIPNAPSMETIEIKPSMCDQEFGEANLNIDTDNMPFNLFIDNVLVNEKTPFRLPADTHSISIVLEDYCRLDTFIFIPSESCPIYIPSAFSPNNDGLNDVLEIYSAGTEVFNVLTYEIYNKWGNKIYDTPPFESTNMDFWWNGEFQNKQINPGIYILQYDVLKKDGHSFSGTQEISLVK